MSAELFAPFEELAGNLPPALWGSDGAHDISHLSRVWRNTKKHTAPGRWGPRRQAAVRSFHLGMVEELESGKENDGE